MLQDRVLTIVLLLYYWNFCYLYGCNDELWVAGELLFSSFPWRSKVRKLKPAICTIVRPSERSKSRTTAAGLICCCCYSDWLILCRSSTFGSVCGWHLHWHSMSCLEEAWPGFSVAEPGESVTKSCQIFDMRANLVIERVLNQSRAPKNKKNH